MLFVTCLFSSFPSSIYFLIEDIRATIFLIYCWNCLKLRFVLFGISDFKKCTILYKSFIKICSNCTTKFFLWQLVFNSEKFRIIGVNFKTLKWSKQTMFILFVASFTFNFGKISSSCYLSKHYKQFLTNRARVKRKMNDKDNAGLRFLFVQMNQNECARFNLSENKGNS